MSETEAIRLRRRSRAERVFFAPILFFQLIRIPNVSARMALRLVWYGILFDPKKPVTEQEGGE